MTCGRGFGPTRSTRSPRRLPEQEAKMTTFDERLHPRGQAANAGQFAAKSNDAPHAELSPGESAARFDEIAEQQDRAEWVARMEALQWERRVREASLEKFMALAAAHAPSDATHAIFDEDSGTVELIGWQNLAGDQLDEEPFDGHQLMGFEDSDHLRDAGFNFDDHSLKWVIELREPEAVRRDLHGSAANWGTDAHYIDDRVHGDGALGAFLAGVTRRSPEVGAHLAGLNDQRVASINRDFESFASLMASKIRDAQEG